MTARGGQHSDIAIHLYMLIRHYKVIKCEIQASEVLQGWEGNDGWVAPTANTRDVANLDRYIADVARRLTISLLRKILRVGGHSQATWLVESTSHCTTSIQQP